jgi:hypothetical protein
MPATERGFGYVSGGTDVDDRDLERLAQSGHLEPVFVDRITRCPSCQSHSLNMREICVACKSSRIVAVELLHHFRCGYVAPSYEFPLEAEGGRRCPKCHGRLRDRGTDHDCPGPSFTCQACDVSFQMPELGGLCLGCGTHLSGNDLDKIIYEDVVAFKLTSVGLAALRRGRLNATEPPPAVPKDNEDADLPVIGRSMLLAFLEDERKRHQRFGSTFSVLFVSTTPPSSDSIPYDERALAEAVRASITDTDKFGRYEVGRGARP